MMSLDFAVISILQHNISLCPTTMQIIKLCHTNQLLIQAIKICHTNQLLIQVIEANSGEDCHKLRAATMKLIPELTNPLIVTSVSPTPTACNQQPMASLNQESAYLRHPAPVPTYSMYSWL